MGMNASDVRQSLKIFPLVLSICVSALIAALCCILGVILLTPVVVLGFVFPNRIGIHLAWRIEHGKATIGRAFAKRMIGKVIS